jgi:putative transcriptional regulator
LEAELASNAWLTCPYDADILFNTACELRLDAAAAKLRVNLSLLTSQAGHA